MDTINLTREELGWIRLTLAAQSGVGTGHARGVDLKSLYGKINMLYNEACKVDRAATSTQGN